eukprot:scaffold7028_cov243-Pinguiococcus_pyrenoidosus.AAC.22
MLPFHSTGNGTSGSGASASSSAGGSKSKKHRSSGAASEATCDWIRLVALLVLALWGFGLHGPEEETWSLRDCCWHRCCSIGCGKWRSLPKNLDTKAFVERRTAWYCVMNTWDPSLASCSAPEETLARYVPW